MSWGNRVVALMFMATSWACTSNVGPLNPKPNVMVRPDIAPSRLVVDASVKDSFVISHPGAYLDVHVTGWRQSLQNGFGNAFPAGATSGRTLELLQANLSFAPAAASTWGVAAVVAMIRFKARLVDRTGTEVASLAGTAQARELLPTPTGPADEALARNAAEAIEALYEQLSERLIAPPPQGDARASQ